MSALRPMIVSAAVRDGELVILGDGEEIIRMSLRSGLYFIGRIANVIATKGASL